MVSNDGDDASILKGGNHFVDLIEKLKGMSKVAFSLDSFDKLGFILIDHFDHYVTMKPPPGERLRHKISTFIEVLG